MYYFIRKFPICHQTNGPYYLVITMCSGPKLLDLDLMNGVSSEEGESELSLKVDLQHFGEVRIQNLDPSFPKTGLLIEGLKFLVDFFLLQFALFFSMSPIYCLKNITPYFSSSSVVILKKIP